MTTSKRRAVGWAAAVCALVMVASVTSTSVVLASHSFSDVPDSNTFHDDISWMAANGISTGYAGGTFRPGEPVTRQAMAAFMHRLDGILRPVKTDRPFHVFVVCAAATRYAVVSAAGGFIRGSAATTVSHTAGSGNYIVTFNLDVSSCSWQMTVGQTGNTGSTTGWANVAGSTSNDNALFLTVWDTPPVVTVGG
jgi:hypothetical protein